MLSEQERATLDEIACRLWVEDPGLARILEPLPHRAISDNRVRTEISMVVSAVTLTVLVLLGPRRFPDNGDWAAGQSGRPPHESRLRCERVSATPINQDASNPPPPSHAQPFKTPFAYLRERRSEAACEALLAEALDRCRAHRRHHRAIGGRP